MKSFYLIILLFSIVLSVHQTNAQRLVQEDCKCKAQLNAKDDNDLNNYIVGGSKVMQPVPWAVSIALRKDDNQLVHFCTGTLLNHEWVMTTARCASRFNDEDNLHKLRIRAGITKLDDKNIGANTFLVKRIVIDDRFDNSTASLGDLGLINILGSIPFSPEISPACLVQRNGTYENEKLRSVGWGYETAFERDKDGKRTPSDLKVSNNLKQARLIYSEDVDRDCDKHLVCTKPLPGTKDSLCAGAPLMHERNGYSIIIGIFQYTQGKGGPIKDKFCDNSPSVFGRVAYGLKTIEGYLDNNYCVYNE